jgi:hypothetical protein
MYAIPKGRDAVAPWPGVRSRRSTSLRSEIAAERAAPGSARLAVGGTTFFVGPLRGGRHRLPRGQHLVRAES